MRPQCNDWVDCNTVLMYCVIALQQKSVLFIYSEDGCDWSCQRRKLLGKCGKKKTGGSSSCDCDEETIEDTIVSLATTLKLSQFVIGMMNKSYMSVRKIPVWWIKMSSVHVPSTRTVLRIISNVEHMLKFAFSKAVFARNLEIKAFTSMIKGLHTNKFTVYAVISACD